MCPGHLVDWRHVIILAVLAVPRCDSTRENDHSPEAEQWPGGKGGIPPHHLPRVTKRSLSPLPPCLHIHPCSCAELSTRHTDDSNFCRLATSMARMQPPKYGQLLRSTPTCLKEASTFPGNAPLSSQKGSCRCWRARCRNWSRR